ncbi:hypothetical protein [Bradyrhizobium sp. BR 10289]|uniref:hypothetical protein n=1 Tax=Bradyrhizobium sp. BR 10289 TaxID=2749993 RepID=UPI001C652B04|nr:hypothetical protein [Bradyrhizobium sp. BR 10289]MBW7970946.1 hypothetical protein [Bradyrhizobium sp. BR 10289]
MVLLKRYVAHETDDFKFEIDEYQDDTGQQRLIAHLRFMRWTPGVLKRVMRDWKLFRTVVTAPLYGSPQIDDERWLKFVTRMGWKPFSTVLCNDGVERPLYIHTV